MKSENAKRGDFLREYVGRLSEDDLNQLNGWLSQKLYGDRAAAAEFLSQDKEMDRWLASASGANEWFDMMDLVSIVIEKELSKKGSDKKEEVLR